MNVSASNAAIYLDDICGQHILVIGDLMLDRFIDGTVERISPEAPVPILSKSSTHTMPGGAANVARNICQLGATCTLIGITGADKAAEELRDALDNVAALSYRPITSSQRPTTTKTRFRSGAQQIMRLDEEITSALSDKDSAKLIDISDEEVKNAAVIILSDYAKGCLTKKVISHIIDLAKDHDIPVIIDPKSDDFSLYRGAYLVTPNLSELITATGLTDTDDAAIQNAANGLRTAHEIDNILTTLSARGMRLDGDNIAAHTPSLTKDVFDVSGAGDTVVAAIACAIAASAPLTDAMILANHAASIVVSKPGTAVCCAGELIASCAKEHEVKSTLDDHQQMIATWREQGQRIGFTNGCFDLLHAGHMHSLREARKHCDRLIIAVNSDRSVAKLKGPSRPIQKQDTRAFVLGHLPYCDAVIIFDEQTPLTLIEAISPDRLIKGGDYKPEEIVGADHVRKKGGDVVTIDLLNGHSTTAFLSQ